jgi:two-component system, NarL family, sensor kinase
LKIQLSIFFIAVSTLFVTAIGQKQEKNYNELVALIKRGSYFDSSAVFTNGNRAIAIAEELKSPSKKAQIYQYFANYHFYSGRMDVAALYYDTSNYIAKSVNDSSLIVSNEVRKTFIQSIQDPYNAETKFKELVRISEKHQYLVSLVESYNGLGIIYEDRQDMPEALTYYLKGLTEAEKTQDPRLLGMIYNNIGLTKVQLKQYDDALTDFKKGLGYAELSDDIRLPFNLENNIGLIYNDKKEYEKAIKHYENTLNRAKKIGFPNYISVSFVNLSNSHNQLGNHELSLIFADSALSMMEELNDIRNIPKTYFLIATAYLDLGNKSDALYFVNKGLDISENEQFLENSVGGYKLKAKVLEAMGLFEEAYTAFKYYHELNDSLYTLGNTEKFQELQMAYNKEKSDAELRQERTKISMLEKENELKRSRMFIFVFSLISILIIGVGGLYLRYVRITRKQQREFTQKLITSVDQERSRISRDLHDDIGQSLSVVKSKVNLYSKGQLKTLDGIDEEIGLLIDQTRSISHSLHPSYLEKIGLKRTIISLLDKIEKNTSLITSYEIDNDIDLVDVNTQTQLYRITQESINNSLKHAEAKSIRIILEKTNNIWSYSYQDNGKGFDLSEENISGIGMQTIKERALKINGKIQFTSQKAKGFKLTISF